MHYKLQSFHLSLALFICILSLKSYADERPNIIFLLTDDQTARAIGWAGNDDVITPNLDQLATDGVRFTNHYNTTSICMASRCCVMTGLYEYRHGCNFGHGDLSRERFEQSYPAILRNAGYYTGFAGKVGFQIEGEKLDAFAEEFDVWAGGGGQTSYVTSENKLIAKYADRFPHSTRAYGAWGRDFLKSAKASGKPFCMSISFKAPHMPFTPAPEDFELYKGRSFTKPGNYGVEKGSHLAAQSKTGRQFLNYREWVQKYDETAARYYALITGVDAAVGMIREGLKNEGVDHNTVIIFTSDNGYNSGSHGFGGKVLPYEEGSKSPLIIHDPRLPKSLAGKTSAALTANVDMAPTILSAAGVAAPVGIDGKDLLPLLTSPEKTVRDALPLFNFWGTATTQSMAIVTQKWKYIYWYSGAENMTPAEELFDLESDELAMKNIVTAPGNASSLSDLRETYKAELSAIKNKAVDDHDYNPFIILFDPAIDWRIKKSLSKDYPAQADERTKETEPKANDRPGKANRKKKESEK